jgi:hypothetical protein
MITAASTAAAFNEKLEFFFSTQSKNNTISNLTHTHHLKSSSISNPTQPITANLRSNTSNTTHYSKSQIQHTALPQISNPT